MWVDLLILLLVAVEYLIGHMIFAAYLRGDLVSQCYHYLTALLVLIAIVMLFLVYT